jgi:hypothetical protein
MLLAGRRLEGVSESDLRQFVLGSTEGDTVEFKRDIWGPNDDQKREMLRDITAFANHSGGEIYVGVEEDANGTAVALPGIAGAGHSERVLNSCRSNIDRNIQGLSAHPVSLSNGNSVLILRIPYSLIGPHMITFGGLNQFWKRYGRTKERMSVEEIEAAFITRVNAEIAAERFTRERQQTLQGKASLHRWLFLSATPLFLRRHAVDVFDRSVEEMFKFPPSPLTTRGLGPTHMGFNMFRPTLNGLRGEEVGRDNALMQYIELHRTGHMEIGVSWLYAPPKREQEQNLLYPNLILEYSYNFTNLAKRIYAACALGTPVILRLAILNAANTRMFGERQEYQHTHAQVVWDEPTLEVPPVYVQDVVSEPTHVMVKTMNDSLWNAFGLRQCEYIDSKGRISHDSGLELAMPQTV